MGRALYYAVAHGDKEVVKSLLAAGPNIDIEELEAQEKSQYLPAEKREVVLQLVRQAVNQKECE